MGVTPTQPAPAHAVSRRCSLLALDPDLGDALEPGDREAARRVLVPVAAAPVGPWRPPPGVAAHPGELGILVLDGLLLRSAIVAGSRCTELLGRGDVLRPWSTDAGELSSVPAEAAWRIVDHPATFAVLGRRVTRQLGHWPAITCELFDRTVRRARWLSFQLAVSQVRSVDERLLMILWHFADRWGQVRRDGVLVDLRLSHRTLGEIVGARRPTVTTAIGRLREQGSVRTVTAGRLLLLGPPPFPPPEPG